MPAEPFEVGLRPLNYDRFRPLTSPARFQSFESVAREAARALKGRTVWVISSTAYGGGVAELLHPMLSYGLSCGIDFRWLVITGDPEFFAITKRIHNGLHNSPGDGGPLDLQETEHYEAVLGENWRHLSSRFKPGDVAIVHDPQPAGMVPLLGKAGIRTIWRGHIGHDTPGDYVTRSWKFLRGYVEPADVYVLTRPSYAPDWMDSDRLHAIQPSIDPFTPKNEELSRDRAMAILHQMGVIHCGAHTPDPALLRFDRSDGAMDTVRRHGDIVHAGPLPGPDLPMVVQVSRWDRLKDMPGVLHAFADHVADDLPCHLVLAGPAVYGIADDPEAADAYNSCLAEWRKLRHFKRCKIQLISLPMSNPEENAIMVNALQTHATVVTQKSLHEGFGLTVSEAMWKGKAVVASAVGGIQDQIRHNESGILVSDPTDLSEFGREVRALLQQEQRRTAMGRAARSRVAEHFLQIRQLEDKLSLLLSLTD